MPRLDSKNGTYRVLSVRTRRWFSVGERTRAAEKSGAVTGLVKTRKGGENFFGDGVRICFGLRSERKTAVRVKKDKFTARDGTSTGKESCRFGRNKTGRTRIQKKERGEAFFGPEGFKGEETCETLGGGGGGAH